MSPSHNPSTSSRPFAAAPDPSRYYPATAIEEARRRIARSIQRGEGPVLVIGAAGLGKTTLLTAIAKQQGQQLQVVQLLGGQLCTRRALLQMILFQLDLPFREMDESELRLSLLSYLQPHKGPAQRLLLLVDEANALPPRLLEELRALTNLSDAGQVLVNVVLAGNATLEEHFADPKLELFSQRVSGRCYLSAFGREETFQYIRAQLTASGGDPDRLFTDDGLEAVFAATDGVPRLVNQLCDQLMWTVSETGYLPLDGAIVQQAWSELQQLPAPWNTQEQQTGTTAVEFGELDADEDIFAESDEDLTEHVEANDEFDDDLPASIPIHQLQPDVEDFITVDLTTDETFDATEDLLAELHLLDSGTYITAEVDIEAVAKNPFDETFESEEVVLDRYSSFENRLLATAPKVVNSFDTSFSEQLQTYETTVPPTTDISTVTTVDSPQTTSSATQDIDLQSPDVTSTAPENSETTNYNRDILVIEDDTRAASAAVVQGQRFRQLFSSLEAESGSYIG